MDLADFSLNIAVALLMGIIIGMERQYRQHTAGLRTNALVCVGAALFVSLSLLLEGDSSPSRVAGQVVTGIGFLGGGVILREGFTVRGMNTAATLWCSAAVGSLAGTGKRIEATIGTATVLFIHLALRPLVHRIEMMAQASQEVEASYRMRVVCDAQQASVLRLVFMRHVNAEPRMAVQGISTQEADEPGRTVVIVDIYSATRNDRYMNDLVSRASIEPSVSAVSWERRS
jgi:putative Mg2+ transporter-C (MgtC) family protein